MLFGLLLLQLVAARVVDKQEAGQSAAPAPLLSMLLGNKAEAFQRPVPATLRAPRAATSTAPARAAGPRAVEIEEEEIEEEEFEAMTEEEYMKSLEEEEVMSQAELDEAARREANKMKSVTGVEFAPWMKVDPAAVAKAKAEREARKAKAGPSVVDPLAIDAQAAELSGTGGLNSKVLSEEEVELRWSTGDETGNKGFIVERRRGGENSFETIATFDSFAPLRTKGVQGGEYVYLDDTAGPGTWVYRIVDEDVNGQRSGMAQKLVEIESQAEQTQQIVVGVFIATLALVAVGVGVFLDPLQTTSGTSLF